MRTTPCSPRSPGAAAFIARRAPSLTLRVLRNWQALRDFTRELLRELPASLPDEDCKQWMLDYGAAYFEAKTNVSRGNAGDGALSGDDRSRLAAALSAMTVEELRERITTIFLDADRDGNGYLDAREFKDVVQAFTRELGLPSANVRRIMAEADENADGCIEYHEFVPLAVDLIQTLIARQKFEEEKQAREDEAVEKSRLFLLHGMSKEELEDVLTEMFRQADTDGSGMLSRSEFRNALKSTKLGLTRREINVLLAEVDTDADGQISYEEFLPLCFNLLVEIVSQEFETASTPSNEAEMKEFFTHLFSSGDVEGRGLLPPHDLAELLRRADLGLTSVQISSLLAEAVVDDDGLVDYNVFAQDAAAIVAALIDVQTNQEKAAKLQEYRRSSDGTVMGMSQSEFEGAMAAALSTADSDATGRVSVQDAADVLMSDSVGLDERQTRALLSVSDLADDNTVDLMLLSTNAFFVLQQIEENAAVTSW